MSFGQALRKLGTTFFFVPNGAGEISRQRLGMTFNQLKTSPFPTLMQPEKRPRTIAPLGWALAALALFMLLLAGRGRSSFVLLHDNFDSEVAWVVLLAKWRLALAGGPGVVVPPIMNGLPRDAMRSGLSVTLLVFSALRDSPLAAYLLHEALVRLAGLLGMYALLRRKEFLPRPEQRGLAAAVALLWAVLPAYSIFGLSVLGQPWLLRAALRLRDDNARRRWPDYLLCLAFPGWSALVLVGVFAGAVWAAALALDVARRGRAAWPATRRGLAGLVLLGLGYAVVEWRMLYSLLVAHEFVAHREAFDLARLEPGGWGRWARQAGQLFWLGQYHASAFFKGGIVLAAGVALLQLHGAARRALARQVALALAGLLALCAGAAALPELSARLQGTLPLLHAFSLERFYFLLALAWVLVLVLALRQLPAGRLAYALVALQLPLALAANPEAVNNLRALAGRPAAAAPGYAAYAAPGLFGQVRQAIARQGGGAPASYRVVCLGLPPAAAQLNGFYTLDSYQTLYPLAYKLAFRRIMAGELAKDAALATYFDAWGNRCYLFSSELGRDFLVGKQPARTVQHLAFDAAAFRALGGRYLLSAVALAHPAESGLRLLGVFDDSQAYWRLHVYEVAR